MGVPIQRPGQKLHALQAGDVRELTRAVAVTALPDAPSVARGVIDVRGDLIPVLDTRRILGHPSKPVELSDHLVLATVRDDYVVALLVDRVRALVDVGEADVEQLEEVVYAGRDRLVGVARLADGLLLICDLEAFLTDAQARALAEAATSAVPAEESA